ncbi:endonuclease III domain-containing protein [Sporobolomyces salmoneus]|uniref:endonuclease III domain-containing protein n=1 Tax=Sporobolomyces salmoneus TaxID=183962 RepID=UPI0031701BEC
MARKAPIKRTSSPPSKSSPAPSSPLSSPEPDVKPKTEDTKPKLSASAVKKIQLYEKTLESGTPFPHWPHPTPSEAQLVADRLASVHGMPTRPAVLVDKPGAPAGCGATPSVLDALIRTILSQNTTSKNSTRAKLSMDEKYGRAQYRKVLEGGEELLEGTIRCGGLAKQKSKSIIGVLRRLDERQRNEGKDKEELSLDWLHNESDEDAMKELISYDLVGIKTASCVLLFCLGRSSFAVDTHVHRLTQSLGWLPPTGSVHTLSPDSTDLKNPQYTSSSKTTTPPSRDQTFYHLDATLPDELKYPLHSLLVRHGRGCVSCAANGVTTQDFVETCPIEDLIVRSRNGKKKGAAKKKVKVENEEGKIVGTVKEDEEGEVEIDVKEEVKNEIGERNQPVKEEEGVDVEEEVKQTKRPTRRNAKRATTVKDESSSEEEEKPAAKRPRVKRNPSSTLDEALPKSKRGAATQKKTKGMEHSVDRDEAEMSGRAWERQEGTMHGLDA